MKQITTIFSSIVVISLLWVGGKLDKPSFENLHQYPGGIEFVVVNRIPAVDDGKFTGQPGKRIEEKTGWITPLCKA